MYIRNSIPIVVLTASLEHHTDPSCSGQALSVLPAQELPPCAKRGEATHRRTMNINFI